jgi:hypothetical protein
LTLLGDNPRDANLSAAAGRLAFPDFKPKFPNQLRILGLMILLSLFIIALL